MQLLACLMATLPKPQRGERQIGLLPMITRVWSRARQHHVLDWDVEHVQFWDKAIAGNSAFGTALFRRLGAEQAVALRAESGEIFVDVEKLFGSLSPARLLSVVVSAAAAPTATPSPTQCRTVSERECTSRDARTARASARRWAAVARRSAAAAGPLSPPLSPPPSSPHAVSSSSVLLGGQTSTHACDSSQRVASAPRAPGVDETTTLPCEARSSTSLNRARIS